jgi:7-cyano-7-deazaguanine synthase
MADQRHLAPAVKKRGAVVLLSGGLDSAAAMLAHIQAVIDSRDDDAGRFEILPLFVHYGQVAAYLEESAARDVVDWTRLHFSKNAGSVLIRDLQSITILDLYPKGVGTLSVNPSPLAYTPLRNAVLISMAAAVAELTSLDEVVVGFIASHGDDARAIPDGTTRFSRAMETALDLGSVTGAQGDPVRIATPVSYLSKLGVLRLLTSAGFEPKVAHSCFLALAGGCGKCTSCRSREESLAQLQESP